MSRLACHKEGAQTNGEDKKMRKLCDSQLCYQRQLLVRGSTAGPGYAEARSESGRAFSHNRPRWQQSSHDTFYVRTSPHDVIDDLSPGCCRDQLFLDSWVADNPPTRGCTPGPLARTLRPACSHPARRCCQVEQGTSYFFKVQVVEAEFIQLRVFLSMFGDAPQLVALRKGVDAAGPLQCFEAAE